MNRSCLKRTLTLFATIVALLLRASLHGIAAEGHEHYIRARC